MLSTSLSRFAALILALASTHVSAVPITITAQLTGDIRAANPDLLFVDTTITSDTTSNTAQWVVKINSPAHPNIKLDQFYFNMVGVASDFSFSNFQPSDWMIATPGGPVAGAGAGNVSFLFKSYDKPGSPKQDVTNANQLSFTMHKLSGNFLASDFLNAPILSAAAGSGQLGAHLQSLSLTAATCGTPSVCQTNSGFAFGSYQGDDPRVPPGGFDVPEPSTLLLLGLASTLLWQSRRRR